MKEKKWTFEEKNGFWEQKRSQNRSVLLIEEQIKEIIRGFELG